MGLNRCLMEKLAAWALMDISISHQQESSQNHTQFLMAQPHVVKFWSFFVCLELVVVVAVKTIHRNIIIFLVLLVLMWLL